MRTFILLITIAISLISCDKENNSAETISEKFVGEWSVSEQSTNLNGSIYFSVFNSTIFKVNDSSFGLIQSNRTPIPMWIYWPDFVDYKTIHFQANEFTREIYSAKPLCGGKYSLNMDTIEFSFQSTSLTTYDVRQRLIRR